MSHKIYLNEELRNLREEWIETGFEVEDVDTSLIRQTVHMAAETRREETIILLFELLSVLLPHVARCEESLHKPIDFKRWTRKIMSDATHMNQPKP